MTPYELMLCIEAYTELREVELIEKITMVWLGEHYHRTKKLPALKDEIKRMIKNEGKKQMTDEEMLDMVKILNSQFGGTIQ